MQRTRLFKSLAIMLAAGLAVAACGDDKKDSGDNGSAKLCDASKGPAEKTKVKLQLKKGFWRFQVKAGNVDLGVPLDAGHKEIFVRVRVGATCVERTRSCELDATATKLTCKKP